jgi:hypothetical protein
MRAILLMFKTGIEYLFNQTTERPEPSNYRARPSRARVPKWNKPIYPSAKSAFS